MHDSTFAPGRKRSSNDDSNRHKQEGKFFKVSGIVRSDISQTTNSLHRGKTVRMHATGHIHQLQFIGSLRLLNPAVAAGLCPL